MVLWITLFGRALAQFSRFRDRNGFRSRKTRARECTYYYLLRAVGYLAWASFGPLLITVIMAHRQPRPVFISDYSAKILSLATRSDSRQKREATSGLSPQPKKSAPRSEYVVTVLLPPCLPLFHLRSLFPIRFYHIANCWGYNHHKPG